MPLASLALLLAAAVDGRAAALCDRLGRPGYADRSAAGRELAALGPAALPALRRAANSPNPEVAGRAAELAAGIRRAIDAGRRTAATLITLDFPSASAADVFAAIEKQAGCRFAVVSEASGWKDRAVTVRTNGPVPFWRAVELAAEAAGWQVTETTTAARSYSSYSPPPYLWPGMVLVTSTPAPEAVGGEPPPVSMTARRPGAAPPTWLGGAVRVRAVDLVNEARSAFPTDVLPVALSVTAEPRLAWLSTTGVRVTRVTAADGRRLEPDLVAPVTDPVGRGDTLVQHPAGRLVQLTRDEQTVKLWVPSDPGTAVARVKAGRPVQKLAELSGVVTGVARVRPEEIASARLDGDKTVAADAADGVSLKAVQPDAGTVEVAVGYPAFRVTPAGGSWRDLRMAEFAQRRGIPMRPRESRYWTPDDGDEIEGVSVTDAAGRRLELSVTSLTTGVELRGGEPVMHRVMKLTVKGAGKPAAVRFRAAVERPVSATFTLTDVPVVAGTGRP